METVPGFNHSLFKDCEYMWNFLIKLWRSFPLVQWWRYHTRPAKIETFKGRKVYIRQTTDYREIFCLDWWYKGIEYTTGCDKSFQRAKSKRKLPWIARMRSKK